MVTPTFSLDSRPLTKRNLNEIAVVASRAFYTDPFFVFLSNRAMTRSRGLTLFFRANIRHWSTGRIVTVRDDTDRVVGAAAWLPTGAYPQSVTTQLAQTPGVLRALYRNPAALRKGFGYLTAIAKNHIRDPHWYLFLLVTDPELQRRGIGAMLMNEALEQIDREGVSSYLETQKEDNIAYYRRFGYELVQTLSPVDGGPPLYAMRRPSH
jgi:ribosomal protein S18 acetylase RimI-like enzyme